MKKIIVILILNLCSNVYSQPSTELSDAIDGSKIKYNKFTKDNTSLYIYKWSIDCRNINSNYEYYHITEKKDIKNINNYPGTFFFNVSEQKDDSVQSLCFILNNEVMIINVKNNFGRVHLNFKEIKFIKGVFEIDFKKITKEYEFKDKEMPKYVWEKEIEFETFPFKEEGKNNAY